MGEGLPISGRPSGLKKTLLKAITKKQLLLLNEIKLNDGNTITALLNRLSNESKMPLSTLKRNAFILRHLELIEYSDFAPARLTKAGDLVLGMVGEKP
ncbi:MAG: hypothetical protein HYW27_04315 [Candidatus Aenigmarchaeota archaeon]|nr:hypothetical protein [Candidatus Aenigmarchaeota archaeon]